MYQGNSGFSSELSQNIPNASMMMMMYSATFGNMGFTVIPAGPGYVQPGFPSIPYLSLEALLYNGQMSNPVVPTHNILSGATSGTQNISGNQTTTDASGNIRVVIGNGSF
jgi:hypothetical protein